MSGDFAGKRVIVAGGSRGIGRSVALGFAAAGAAVSICARAEGPLIATQKEIEALGVTAHGACVDLADADVVGRYVPAAAAALGGLDVLVNNASGFGQADDEEGWEASLAVDVMAVVRASRAAAPLLGPGSSIVNIASISALRASARSAPYGAAKAAVMHYTASQAKMLGRRGIRVNCVAPGSVEFPGGTPRTRRFTTAPWRKSRSAAWDGRRRSPASCCSSHPRRQAGSPGRASWWTAGSSSGLNAGSCAPLRPTAPRGRTAARTSSRDTRGAAR